MSPFEPQTSPPACDPDPADGHSDTAGPPHPWRRFFARHLDFVLLAAGIGVLITLVGWEDRLGGLNDYALVAALYVLWTVCEAILLSVVGTTPGKFLFGLSIAREDGGRPDFLQAFGRSWSVLVLGCGLGPPLVSLMTYHTSYRKLDYNGCTSWDESRHLVVRSPARAWWVWVLAWLGALVISSMILICAALVLGMRDPALRD